MFRRARRRAAVAVAVVMLLVVALVLALGRGNGGRRGSSAVPTTRGFGGSQGAPAHELTRHSPVTVLTVRTPVQQQYDRAFEDGLGRQTGMSSASALRVPAPAISGGWPTLPVEVTPEAWARTFVQGLVTIDFAGMSRSALGPWLQAQEAPELIAGVPASVADKVLYLSLLEPGIFGGQPTPIPSPAEWQANAEARVRQSVSDLLVQTDPAWAEMVTAGWQPTDVRMTQLQVSGLLTVTRDGTVTTHHFRVTVIVGSARWHDGYGTVAVSGWGVEA